MPTALIAEDEPLLLAELKEALGDLWPELAIVAESTDGAAALAALRQHAPDVAFLDINMPKASGLDVARMCPPGTAIVFLTAYGQHALDAFDVGAADYLVKPLNRGRLLETIGRLRARTDRAAPPAVAPAPVAAEPVRHLAWIQASVGNMIRVITTDEVIFFQSDAKYTKVATAELEALIRIPVKDLAVQLDPDEFIQVSRGAIVNRRKIEAIIRRDGQMDVRLKGRTEVLSVSTGYQGQAAFRQM
ncbi:LytR/AlgR family response regulator transcription factor [Massilia yuzhufengensis]|uniref:Two component transcriptional regulator, LytTR family n=1 Tax=Massilia yuzhufengensis TaxID=1164594 RepID=A0A1I1LJC3_9BURK|nr:LytTR family DNA-binding domain-containing protein [Massilia yuzhufengensis]SFC71068.1 two component transcriptional regulator, LytTR family [Massilia yuzhufengensis]